VFSESYFPAEHSDEVLELSVGQLLARAARRSPDRVALVSVEDDRPRREWTYAELLRDAELVARALLAHFEPGDHLAVWSANRFEWTLLEWGCALAGIVLVSVHV